MASSCSTNAATSGSPASRCCINQVTIVRNSSGKVRISAIVTPTCLPVGDSEDSSFTISPDLSSCTQDLGSDLAHTLAIGMIRIGQTENAPTAQSDHFFGKGQDAGDGGLIGRLDLLPQRSRIHFGEHLIEHQQQALQFELASHLDGHGRPLQVLLIGSQDEDKHVRDNNGEERLLVEARMSIDEEIIELQHLHQLAKAIGEEIN